MGKRKKEIRILVSDEEYNVILEQAKKKQMQIAPYIRTVAQNPTIRYFDYSPIEKHTCAIAEIRNSINQLIFTIELTNNYQPREIMSIVNYMKEVFRSENELLKIVRKICC